MNEETAFHPDRGKRMEKLKRMFLSIICVIFALNSAGCAGSDKEVFLNEADQTTLLEDAYIFTLPLMMMDATATTMTNTIHANEKQAPVNQLCHARQLADADFKNVVTPNVDTIYSQMILDLSEDAVILELPKTDRFCTAQLLDAYTNCVDVIDASEFEKERETFIFTKNDFEGEIPAGMTQIQYPSPMGWIIIRTICFDKADEAAVHEIQGQMKTYTLSQYKAQSTDEQPEGTYDEKDNIVPSQYVMQLSMGEYFEKANELMAINPPAPADAPMMERLAKINVGPGLAFDISAFGDEADAMWKNLTTNIVSITKQRSAEFFTQKGNWSYMGYPIAEFGTEYAYRAFITLFGFGANPVSVAVYPKTDIDSGGDRLNGTNKYTLHFEAGELPPVEGYGFWSVTAYDSTNNFLIDNEIDRYCINNRSDVLYNEDGSLDICIQSTKPENDSSNWLPVADGDFHLVLRIYMPGESVIKNEWPTPVLSKAA